MDDDSMESVARFMATVLVCLILLQVVVSGEKYIAPDHSAKVSIYKVFASGQTLILENKR